MPLGRVEENPDHIDIVPVDGAGLNAPVALRRVMALARQVPDNRNEDDA